MAFLWEKTERVCMLLQSSDAFLFRGEWSSREEKGEGQKMRTVEAAAVCDSGEVTSNYHETYFSRGEERRFGI